MSAVGGDNQGRITGRGFASRQDDAFRALNDSIGFDWRLAPYDVDQSIAHATMLGDRGIIGDADRDELTRGLEQVRDELRDGAFPFAEDDEDIHMAIERRLTEIVGPVGGRLHTARSRNDQVATDVAMFVHAHAQDAPRPDPAPGADADRRRRAPPGLADARLHPPPARAARVPVASPAGLRVDARP